MTAGAFLNDRVTLHAGDCLDVLRGIPDATFDSVVTDPPYALVSIVKRFANSPRNEKTENVQNPYGRTGRGFMGKSWDNGERAFAVEFWAEVLRVLKPGGHVVAFSGTRTYHRMVVAIEDAGFEIRDQIGWVYGSGFPKSHDVSKGIDKALGAERRVIAEGAPVKRMVPGSDQHKVGWEKTNGRVYVPSVTEAGSDEAAAWQGWGTALKPAWEPIVLARKALTGTVAENVLEHGTGAINVNGCRIGSDIVGWGGGRGGSEDQTQSQGRSYRLNAGVARPVVGRWPANIVHDGSDEVVSAFPDSDGQQGDVRGNEPSSPLGQNVYGDMNGRLPAAARGDTGSAARFFYSAKADAHDRIGSKHPTVKPVDLMQWLVRLVTPKGGRVLDPFAGTGTTGEAAWREGMRCVLIEREEEYRADIARRMRLADRPTEREAVAKAKGKTEQPESLPLFGGGMEAAE